MKTSNIVIRISEDSKEEFYKITNNNAQTPSVLLRKWIEKYVEENKSNETKRV